MSWIRNMRRKQKRDEGKGVIAPKQKAHAQRRAWERFGVDLDGKTYRNLTNAITRGDYSHRAVGRITTGRSAFVVDLGGKTAIAIYAKTTRKIVTFVTEEMIRNTFEYKGIKINEGAFRFACDDRERSNGSGRDVPGDEQGGVERGVGGGPTGR